MFYQMINTWIIEGLLGSGLLQSHLILSTSESTFEKVSKLFMENAYHLLHLIPKLPKALSCTRTCQASLPVHPSWTFSPPPSVFHTFGGGGKSTERRRDKEPPSDGSCSLSSA